MRKTILWVTAGVILLTINWVIVSKEHTLANGQLMLLDLAPRDPRSILQGDYMALRYRIAQDIERSTSESITADGYAVVLLDQNKLAHFVRLHQPSSVLSTGEYLLHYRVRGGRVKVATDAYFFQEGKGREFAKARYGKFRVDSSGANVLVGLCDEQWNALPKKADGSVVPCLTVN